MRIVPGIGRGLRAVEDAAGLMRRKVSEFLDRTSAQERHDAEVSRLLAMTDIYSYGVVDPSPEVHLAIKEALEDQTS
jgi:hypothetical protein